MNTKIQLQNEIEMLKNQRDEWREIAKVSIATIEQNAKSMEVLTGQLKTAMSICEKFSDSTLLLKGVAEETAKALNIAMFSNAYDESPHVN